MNITLEETDEYVSKKCYTIEDIDFSKALGGNQ